MIPSPPSKLVKLFTEALGEMNNIKTPMQLFVEEYKAQASGVPYYDEMIQHLNEESIRYLVNQARGSHLLESGFRQFLEKAASDEMNKNQYRKIYYYLSNMTPQIDHKENELVFRYSEYIIPKPIPKVGDHVEVYNTIKYQSSFPEPDEKTIPFYSYGVVTGRIKQIESDGIFIDDVFVHDGLYYEHLKEPTGRLLNPDQMDQLYLNGNELTREGMEKILLQKYLIIPKMNEHSNQIKPFSYNAITTYKQLFSPNHSFLKKCNNLFEAMEKEITSEIEESEEKAEELVNYILDGNDIASLKNGSLEKWSECIFKWLGLIHFLGYLRSKYKVRNTDAYMNITNAIENVSTRKNLKNLPLPFGMIESVSNDIRFSVMNAD